MKEKIKALPKATALLVLVNVIVFVLCTFMGDLLYNEGCVGLTVIEGPKDYYRLVSALFLHSGIDHIFSNMLLLYFAGEMLERKSSPLWILFIYFGGGIFGNLISMGYESITMDYSLSVGASGSVFAILGSFLMFVLTKRLTGGTLQPWRVGGAIMISLYAGFRSQGVNNAAHVGGLIFGCACGLIYCKIKENSIVEGIRPDED